MFSCSIRVVGPEGNSSSPIITRPGSGDFYEGLNFHFADGQATQSGDQFMGRGLVEPDNNNFAPRIGLSWSPTDRWTVRTGFGVFFVQDSGNPVFDMARNLAGRDLFITSIEQRNAVLEDPWALRASAFHVHWLFRHVPRPAADSREHPEYADALHRAVDVQYTETADE